MPNHSAAAIIADLRQNLSFPKGEEVEEDLPPDKKKTAEQGAGNPFRWDTNSARSRFSFVYDRGETPTLGVAPFPISILAPQNLITLY